VLLLLLLPPLLGTCTGGMNRYLGTEAWKVDVYVSGAVVVTACCL
jgi:hypothetical protein